MTSDDYAKALAKYLKVPKSKVEYEDEGTWGYGFEFKVGDKNYLVCDEEEANKSFLKTIKSNVDDLGFDSYFGNFYSIENYVDPDAFYDEMDDHSRSYAEDIEHESDDTYANRFIQECVERGVVNDDDLVENENGLLDFADESDRDDAFEEFVESYNSDFNNSLDYVLNDFGEEFVLEAYRQGDVDIDFEQLAYDIERDYGRGHELSYYDGEEIELGNGLYAYRL